MFSAKDPCKVKSGLIREYQKRVKEVNEIWDNRPFKNIEDIDDDQYDKEYQEAKKELKDRRIWNCID